MIKGLFNKTQIKEFIYPLNVIANILDPKDDGGIILNFDKDKKDIKIYTKKHSIGTIIFVTYNDLINNFEIDNDKLGIINISDFIKYFSIIDDENTEIQFKDNLFSIKDNDSEISFKTADLSTITEFNKNFNFKDFICEIELDDDKFKKLNKAIKALSSEDYIYIKGKDNKIFYTIKRKDIDFNTFKWNFDATLKKDFEIIIKKDLYQMATTLNSDKKILKIAERFIMVESIRDNSSISMFVAKSNI